MGMGHKEKMKMKKVKKEKRVVLSRLRGRGGQSATYPKVQEV